jgi:hypothetical protein
VLPRGRYYASLSAGANPVGSVKGPLHSAEDLGTDGEDDCPDRPRGQGNDRAFTAILRRDGVAVARRLVPRGLFGADPDVDRSQIIFEVDADGTSRYALDVEDAARDVRFSGGWRFIRNPDVNEIKVVTWNFYYKAYQENEAARIAILKNAVDLLATQGDIDPVRGTIVERPDQAPWQWDADVVAFQEFWRTTAPHVFARLAVRSPYEWVHINANTEISEHATGNTNVFYGPVFVNDLVRPENGIKFSDKQLDDRGSDGRCNSRYEEAAPDFACPLGFYNAASFNLYSRAVPARLRARRSLGTNAATDRPVAFFNWHLFFEPKAFDQRATNVDNLIKSIKYLMVRPADGNFAAGACAFNKECANDPKHRTNRIIIVGDSNMKSHQCGEFAWTLERLRAEFGYAVDASAAVVDPMNRTFDMHWSGASLTNSNTSIWGTCREKNGPWSKTVNADGEENGCPFQFQHRTNFNDAIDFTTKSWYPWWAATTQDQNDSSKGGGRMDVVLLVGRGWADDDPVLTYRVMAHHGEPSPMNGMLGGGVEIGFDPASCEGPVRDEPCVDDKPCNYAPNVPITHCGTHPGAPAIRSDHIPTGARLRIWGR